MNSASPYPPTTKLLSAAMTSKIMAIQTPTCVVLSQYPIMTWRRALSAKDTSGGMAGGRRQMQPRFRHTRQLQHSMHSLSRQSAHNSAHPSGARFHVAILPSHSKSHCRIGILTSTNVSWLTIFVEKAGAGMDNIPDRRRRSSHRLWAAK